MYCVNGVLRARNKEQKDRLWLGEDDDDEKQFILKYVQEQQIIHLLKLIIITPALGDLLTCSATLCMGH